MKKSLTSLSRTFGYATRFIVYVAFLLLNSEVLFAESLDERIQSFYEEPNSEKARDILHDLPKTMEEYKSFFLREGQSVDSSRGRTGYAMLWVFEELNRYSQPDEMASVYLSLLEEWDDYDSYEAVLVIKHGYNAFFQNNLRLMYELLSPLNKEEKIHYLRSLFIGPAPINYKFSNEVIDEACSIDKCFCDSIKRAYDNELKEARVFYRGS